MTLLKNIVIGVALGLSAITVTYLVATTSMPYSQHQVALTEAYARLLT